MRQQKGDAVPNNHKIKWGTGQSYVQIQNTDKLIRWNTYRVRHKYKVRTVDYTGGASLT